MPHSAPSPASVCRSVSMCPYYGRCSLSEPTISPDTSSTTTTTRSRSTSTTTTTTPPLIPHSSPNHRPISAAGAPHALRKDSVLLEKTGKGNRSPTISGSSLWDLGVLEYSSNCNRVTCNLRKLSSEQQLVDLDETITTRSTHVRCKSRYYGVKIDPVLNFSQTDSEYLAICGCQVTASQLSSPQFLPTCKCGKTLIKQISSSDRANSHEVNSNSWIHITKTSSHTSQSNFRHRNVNQSHDSSDTIEDTTLRNFGDAIDVTGFAECRIAEIIKSKSARATSFIHETLKGSCESNLDTQRITMEHSLPSVSVASCSDCCDERTKPMTSKQSYSKPLTPRSRQSSRSYGSYFTQVLATVSALLFLISPAVGTMDIWAFEYRRQFDQDLKLGQCPMREVLHNMGNQTLSVKYKCDLTYPGKVRHVDKSHKRVRNIMITKPENITVFLGLCGGEAASFLGILNSGDCVGLELASKLSFSPRTLVRAYISYYKKSVDVLDKGTDIPLHIRRMRERESGLENKYYLQSIEYGTQEIIFVQFRFMTTEEADKARKIRLQSAKMTDYMKRIRSYVGTPKIVTVISMSTSDPASYKVERFDTLRSTPEAWNRTFRHVDIQERIMNYTNERIDKGIIKPHLKYQFSPFLEEQTVGFRINGRGNPKEWEEISMIEVKLRADISLAKRNSRKCRKINRGRFKDLCRRVRHHRKMLVELKKEIHSERVQWGKLEAAKKQRIIFTKRNEVDIHARRTRNLTKEVRKMRRELKHERLMEKSKQRNQIPLTPTKALNKIPLIPSRTRPHRRHRHRGNRAGKGTRGSKGSKHRKGIMEGRNSRGSKFRKGTRNTVDSTLRKGIMEGRGSKHRKGTTVGRGSMERKDTRGTTGSKLREGAMENRGSKTRKGIMESTGSNSLRGQLKRRVIKWENKSKRKHLKKTDRRMDPNLRYHTRHRRRRIRPRPRKNRHLNNKSLD